MRVAVLGASGRTGRATVKNALDAGHDVVSIVRTAASAPSGTAVAQADARDSGALAAAIRDTDAVVSCIGHVAADGNVTLLHDGAVALVAAMASAGVSRLVAVSAAGAYIAGDDPLSRFIAKPVLERVLKANLEDTRAMEDVIRSSATSWTLLRPARLITGEGERDYRRRLDRSIWWHYNTRFDTVGRAAVDALGRSEWVGHAVFVTG